MSANAAAPSANPDRPDSDFSTLTILLLQGVLYRAHRKRLWRTLLEGQEQRVRDYVAVLGLELVIDEDDGYALLRPRGEAGAGGVLPLLPSSVLPLPSALLLARLRKALADSDAHGDAMPLVFTQAELAALLRPFLAPSGEDASLPIRVQVHVDRLVELGVLRRLASRTGPAAYEVQRTLRAIADPSWLRAFEQSLASASATSPGARRP